MRLEVAGIIGAGQEIVHQRCALEMGGAGMYFTEFTFQ